MRLFWKFGITVFCLLLLLSKAALAEPNVHKGFSSEEKEKLWHLSEGADFMPLRWFLNIRSATSLSKETLLFEDLSGKFGAVETTSAYNLEKLTSYGSEGWRSPMKWIGLTLAWSEPAAQLITNKDLATSAPKPKNDDQAESLLREIDQRGAKPLQNSPFGGRVEVPMVGTNCALCHSSQMAFGDQNVFVEGAPNMFHVRNFFRDMTASTIATMADKDRLKDYLQRLNRQGLTQSGRGEIAEQANEFVDQFKRAVIGDTTSQILKGLWGALQQVGDGENDLFDGDLSDDTRRAVLLNELSKDENREVIADQLVRFLVLSYPNITYEQVKNTPALWKRMLWLAMILNTRPELAQTTEGYGRTDAFGRISNSVARGQHPIPLVAPVSFPPMWGMEFSSLFHYNGNTNSVIMRNIGQSFGLGALLLDDQYSSTSNIFNLNQMEKLIYRIKVPEWNALVPEKDRLTKEKDLPEVMQGCNIYLKTCWKCHDSQGRRVGPEGKLIAQDVFSIKKIGTDINHTALQATPVIVDGNKVPFRQALFDLTKKIKERYIDLLSQDSPLLRDEELMETLSDWGNYGIRGMEHFRDPYLGENFSDPWLQSLFSFGRSPLDRSRFDEIVEELDYMALKDKKTGDPKKHAYGYIAKDLAGVWASAPYLHNGSIPTLWHLISPQEQRPRRFIVGCREYDSQRMGLIWNMSQAEEAGCLVTEDHWLDTEFEISQNFVVNGSRAVGNGTGQSFWYPDHLGANVVFTNGNTNKGHNFAIKNPADKRALIQFLKVLRPTAEYDWQSEPWYKIEPALSEKELDLILATGQSLKPHQMKCRAL